MNCCKAAMLISIAALADDHSPEYPDSRGALFLSAVTTEAR
jgi:hypothetical protein